MNVIPDIDDFRKVFLKFTRKTFNLLPKIDNPKIIDIGCGTGIVSLELVKLTNCEIIALDIDNKSLKIFNKRIRKRNLNDRITTKNCSLLKSGLKKGDYDIIWAEGVIHIIGFNKGFKVCYNLLKPGGFFILTETIMNMKKNMSLIDKFGFELYGKINWEKVCWWTDYYEPLEKILKKLREEKINPDLYINLSSHEKEISTVKNNPERYDCAHYILKKKL